MKTNRFLYHKSAPKLRHFIKSNGLLPYRGEQWIDTNLEAIKEPAVFATNSENKTEWFDSCYDDDVWRIDTNKLNNTQWQEDPAFCWQYKNKHIYTTTKIPIEALELIYLGSGELK